LAANWRGKGPQSILSSTTGGRFIFDDCDATIPSRLMALSNTDVTAAARQGVDFSNERRGQPCAHNRSSTFYFPQGGIPSNRRASKSSARGLVFGKYWKAKWTIFLWSHGRFQWPPAAHPLGGDTEKAAFLNDLLKCEGIRKTPHSRRGQSVIVRPAHG